MGRPQAETIARTIFFDTLANSKIGRLATLTALTAGFSAIAAPKGVSGTEAKTPAVKCSVSELAVSTVGKLTVNGVCRKGGKSIPSQARVTYTGHDNDNYACGTTKATLRGKNLSLVPSGMDEIEVTARYLPKGKFAHVISHAKRLTANLVGDPNLQCGKPINLPPPSVLCDRSEWPPYGWPASLVANCGQPVRGGLAFSSPMTLVEGILSAGHVVSPSGRCVFGPWNDPPQYGLPDQRLLCSDDVGGEVYLAYGLVADSQGKICPDSLVPAYAGQRRMDIPKTWKGTLYIVAAVDSYARWSTTRNRIGGESQTARFELQGSQEPC